MDSITLKLFLSISGYATASTKESIFILGGTVKIHPTQHTSRVAEYKDGIWKHVGDLAQAKSGIGAITSGPVTMLIGGGSLNENGGNGP